MQLLLQEVSGTPLQTLWSLPFSDIHGEGRHGRVSREEATVFLDSSASSLLARASITGYAPIQRSLGCMPS